MSDIESNFFSLASSYSKKDQLLFSKAIAFSRESFNDKKLLTGILYSDYAILIASHLVENNLSSDLVVAGLLYGVEKVALPIDIQSSFGGDVSSLLFGLLQFKEIKKKNSAAKADFLRQIILVTLKDPRVIFLKLASKIESLRSLDVFDIVKQKEIAQEVLDMYGPLAYRLGLEKMRVILEEEAFKIINPRKFREIESFLKESRIERERTIKKILSLVSKTIGDKVQIVSMKGRPKHLVSIYKKFHKSKLSSQKDHQAIRIIVSSVDDCYNILGLLHESFNSLDGALKDYIVSPKGNGYQSLHTVLILDFCPMVEVQIRTKEMDEIAEEGLAAHWSYKKMNSNPLFERRTDWLKSLLELQKDSKTKEFLDTVNVDLFGDRFYCYTPKGKVIDLPDGACVLDFAYNIHREVGDRAVGARINGVFSPLKTILKSGDVVEIVTNKHQHPRRDWLKYVVSARAKQKIRRSLKHYDSVPPPHYKKLVASVSDSFDTLVYSDQFPTMPCNLAKCCSPLPGSAISGLITKRKLISVHSSSCRVLLKEKDRLLIVFWKDSFNRPLMFSVEAKNRSGLLADILHTISRGGFVVKEAKAKLMDPLVAKCSFVIAPRELDDVVTLVSRVKNIRGVLRMDFN